MSTNTQNQNAELLKHEKSTDDKCIRFFVSRELCIKDTIFIIDGSIYIGKTHLLNVMKRNSSVEDQQMNLEMIHYGLTAPISQLYHLKCLYKFKAYRMRFWAIFLFLINILIITIVLFLYNRDVIKLNF